MAWDYPSPAPSKHPTPSDSLQWSDLAGDSQRILFAIGIVINIAAIVHLYLKMRSAPVYDVAKMRYAKIYSKRMCFFTAGTFVVMMIVHIASSVTFIWYIIFLGYWIWRYLDYKKKINNQDSPNLLHESSVRTVVVEHRVADTTVAPSAPTLQSDSNPQYPHQEHYHHQQQYHHPQIAVADLWKKWATQFPNEMAVRNYMHQIQMSNYGGPKIRLLKATMIANEGPCRNFISSINYDTFLFHGSSEADASNIQSEGLLMKYAAKGYLGKGLYGAPDPRKAFFYSRHNNKTGRFFMFLGRYNTAAGNARSGKGLFPGDKFNYEEYAVYDERHVVLLWHLKVQVESW